MSLAIDETAVARRNSITELCAAFEQSADEVKTAFALIVSAQDRLTHFFGDESASYRFRILSESRHSRHPDPTDSGATIKELSREVWAALVQRLELRKMMSLKRIAELDKQLESGEDLPELTASNVLAMLETTLNSAGQMLEEKVLECYEMLRPCGWSLKDYKTNQKSAEAGVGQKVIMTWAVRRSYSNKGNFEAQYGGTRDKLRALDQVFHLLDGKPQANGSWAGELCDAIREQTGNGKNSFETQYFRGRCFANNNLHLEFKRDDLVGKFNLIAGGSRLNNVNS